METILILCGPTASGKTAAALELAQEIGGEIVSADSGQVYCGLDIGTAKPSEEERRRVPFHLLDVVTPDLSFSAAQFAESAWRAVEGIRSRGRRPIVAGGTGLYLKALEEGLFDGPTRSPEIRDALEKRFREEGGSRLHEELSRLDPVAARGIPPGNRQRLIRALEVYQLTGKPISEFWREQAPKKDEKFVKIGLALPKDDLYRRIEARVDRMIARGLVNEVANLLETYPPTAPGLRIIGYKEIVDFLAGSSSLEEAVNLIKIHTRQYAKRQLTWFRRDLEIRWVGNLNQLSEF